MTDVNQLIYDILSEYENKPITEEIRKEIVEKIFNSLNNIEVSFKTVDAYLDCKNNVLSTTLEFIIKQKD